jgi:hypothetical protein
VNSGYPDQALVRSASSDIELARISRVHGPRQFAVTVVTDEEREE